MFSKILVANRGEIAVRIIRACREMGISTVAVYSQADRNALHVSLADESYCIGGPEAAESYLCQERIISAACLSGAQAVHPGYGFLSENAQFARLCRKNGLVFIGPDPEAMERLSDKAALKAMMAKTSLRVIPGTGILGSQEEALAAGENIGYPLMLKAAAGGGGRGIRLVRTPQELAAAYPQARTEAISAFGDGSLYLEKYISPARHIEFQLLADEYGNALCLGERDCSLQRRNQKLLEETPSPGVSAKQRAAMIPQVLDALRTLNYVGVGTMEFLMDAQGNFWFMEMNVRLQVEHAVSEMLCGVDLVKWQIRIAAGIPLQQKQQEVVLQGSAVECRINARGCGTVTEVHVPGGPGVRFDTDLLCGTQVSPYYDALVGKLIVCSPTREETLRKLRAALCELVIEGVPTNIQEQIRIVDDERFTGGTYNLTFLR